MGASAAARFLGALDKSSGVIFLFAILFFVYFITRYFRCASRIARRGRFRFTEENPSVIEIAAGLDRQTMESLPVFVCKSQRFKNSVLECAVCLGEIKENEKAKLLPSCKHSFHMDCIDMWLHSHSTCPLCRTRVRANPSAKVAESAPRDSGVV